jgi:hypothetical protein
LNSSELNGLLTIQRQYIALQADPSHAISPVIAVFKPIEGAAALAQSTLDE